MLARRLYTAYAKVTMVKARLGSNSGEQSGQAENHFKQSRHILKPTFSFLMQKAISGILAISEKDISIKATTTEQLGFVGREEGLMAYATVLLEKSDG